MRYLITGTGRCGTGYVAELLTSAGSSCGHEQIFTLKGPEYARKRMAEEDLEGDSSWLAAPWLGEDWLKGVTVVQLVRHPVAVIRSHLRMGKWTGRYGRFVKYAQRHLPEVARHRDLKKRSVCWWIGWNRLIAPYADLVHRIEDEDGKLLDFLGIDWRGKELFSDTRFNSRTIYNVDFRMKDLPPEWRKKLRAEMEIYGYQ